MNDGTVTIGADGVDTDTFIAAAKAAVATKREDGTYHSAGLDGIRQENPLEYKSDAAFLAFYLESLREAAFVDINDFEIAERRRFSSVLVRFKKAIWGVLKFYTYRLWSQQNQVNGLLLSAIEGIHEQQQEKLGELEARIAELEAK